ncbi:hypothetical protein [Desulfobacula phenolica]|uniref:Uncharacterized protein n=1 Tax=Desulfobacula phenolica TaxID=90732 RepID=A0A1H2H4L1_9BACT|nr:hypothetical protein [Desulfobacula phenolica]SDU26669.1 hypothetical protein SAMN04487931_10639 [Desulfobacula phenolica]
MRSIRANHNIIAVSAYAKETAINTAQTLDLSLLASVGDIITLDPRRESNKDELTGKEEADTIYNLGQTASLSLNFPKAQPQHFALLYAYALGTIASTAAGTGYLKTITPLDGDLETARSLPSFTGGQRLGKTIAKERFSSLFVNGVTSTFARDDWCKVVGDIVATGKYDTSIEEESITAAENVTTLTLAANAVAGSTAQERLDAIHRIRVETSAGVWEEVAFSAVSSATPAEITITALGAGTDDKTYKVLYAPAETAWMTFPARVSETPLRVSELTFKIGGKYDGSAFQGGRELGAEINGIEHRLSNNGNVEFVPGGGGSYASQYFRDGRDQTLALDREFRDYIIRNYMNTDEYFGASILAEGAEFDTGHKYGVEIIFPRLGVLKTPVTANGKRLAEKGDMTVLEDDTYGSVIVKVKNLAQYYAN